MDALKRDQAREEQDKKTLTNDASKLQKDINALKKR